MPTDLDPIAVLRRTDPAAELAVPPRPAVDELTPIPEALAAPPRRSARVVAAVAVVVLLAGSLAAAVAITTQSDDGQPVRPTGRPERTDQRIRETLIVSTWTLDEVADGRDGGAASPVPDDTYVQLTFRRDGTYAFESVCAISTGTYAVDGGGVTLDPPSTDGVVCDEMPPGDEVVLAFARALRGAHVVTVDGARLVVTSGKVHYVLAGRAMPYFRPAPGWEALPQGAGATVATAASISLGPGTRAGELPWDTVDRLEDGDVVLFAMLVPTGDSPVVDANVSPRELPLSLDDAVSDVSFEGQPDHIYAQRLSAQVDGWNIDLLVFYGSASTEVPPGRTEPSARTVAAAQEQLARLVVPSTGG